VAAIVAGCSDTDESPKPPWGEGEILRDHRAIGEAIWERFNAPVGEQLWYLESLVAVFRERSPGPMVDELAEVVGEIRGRHEQATRAAGV